MSQISTRLIPLLSAAVLGVGVLLASRDASAGAPYYGIQVNGTCDVGACNFSNPTPFNTNLTQTYSLLDTLANGDQFRISGSATAYNDSIGGYLPEGDVYTVTYLGDGHAGASAADTISINSFFAVQTDYGTGNFDAGAVGYLSGGLGAGSSAQYSGYGAGLTGPTLSGPYTAPGAFNGDYSYGTNSTNGEFEFELSSISQFAAGSAIGSYMEFGGTTPIPEPASLALLGLGAATLSLVRHGRQKVKS